MIETTSDLELKDLDPKDPEIWVKIDSKLKEKLNLGLDEIKTSLIKYIGSNAGELTLNIANIAPYNDYSKLIEDNDGMAEFLKTEAIKPENWILYEVSDYDRNKFLLLFSFGCMAINDGQTLEGRVFVSKSGVIRHAFVISNE